MSWKLRVLGWRSVLYKETGAVAYPLMFNEVVLAKRLYFAPLPPSNRLDLVFLGLSSGFQGFRKILGKQKSSRNSSKFTGKYITLLKVYLSRKAVVHI